MSYTQPTSDQRVISYLTLRKAIGLIGILLPVVLAGVYMLLASKIIFQASISAYYYTSMRNVLVGALCAIGVFLFAYRGYGWQDNLCTNAAGAFAVGVAWLVKGQAILKDSPPAVTAQSRVLTGQGAGSP